ncbi:MAG: DNA-3-methyladenine glycosylase I [Nocardioidaceae bacterium]
MSAGVVVGDDGLRRCPWGISTPDYLAYHDTEWGRPIHDDSALFERLTLEAFQSGLSWLTILRKRESFRRAFASFDIAAVASFDEADRARLMADAGIVRNRAKVDAALANARAALALDEPLADLMWRFAPDTRPAPRTTADVPAQTAESQALARALKAHRFVFVGPVTGYALMQAVGMVDDHLSDCSFRVATA